MFAHRRKWRSPRHGRETL